MAVGLSMALVVIVAQLLVMASQQRRLARQYAVATQEAGNLMEAVIARSWNDTASKALSALSLSETGHKQLPEAKLTVDVAKEENDVRRITVRIEWQSGSERPRDCVRLVGWKYRTEEDES